MGELCMLPGLVRFLISAATDVSVILQAVAVACSLHRFGRSRLCYLESLFEIIILIQLFLCAMLMAEAQYQAMDGFAAYGGYLIERYFVFALLCLIGIVLSFMRRTAWPLSALIAASAILPLAEQWIGRGFAIIYLAVLIYWLLRAVFMILLHCRELNTQISALSVKEAIDSLNSGILFCEEDGLILLCNCRMLELMVALTGAVELSGQDFLKKLKQNEILPECRREQMGDHLVFRLHDDTIWFFSVHKMEISHKNCFMIFAANQTEQWKNAQGLLRQNRALERREQELRQRMQDLQEEVYREELFRARSWTHDVLGQRISLLLRALREDREPNEVLLQSFSDGLSGIMTDDMGTTPEHTLEQLIKIYRGLGVMLQIDGQLPADREHADTFVKIAAECVSNAVRHGYCTLVTIRFRNRDRMEVENNGILPVEPFEEGSGIREMRRKAERLGGSLTVSTQPHFRITVTIPEGNTEWTEF